MELNDFNRNPNLPSLEFYFCFTPQNLEQFSIITLTTLSILASLLVFLARVPVQQGRGLTIASVKTLRDQQSAK